MSLYLWHQEVKLRTLAQAVCFQPHLPQYPEPIRPKLTLGKYLIDGASGGVMVLQGGLVSRGWEPPRQDLGTIVQAKGTCPPILTLPWGDSWDHPGKGNTPATSLQAIRLKVRGQGQGQGVATSGLGGTWSLLQQGSNPPLI